jgi:hypothetical protein
VVKAFIAMPENIWGDLRKEIDAQIYRFTYPPKDSRDSTKNGPKDRV